MTITLPAFEAVTWFHAQYFENPPAKGRTTHNVKINVWTERDYIRASRGSQIETYAALNEPDRFREGVRRHLSAGTMPADFAELCITLSGEIAKSERIGFAYAKGDAATLPIIVVGDVARGAFRVLYQHDWLSLKWIAGSDAEKAPAARAARFTGYHDPHRFYPQIKADGRKVRFARARADAEQQQIADQAADQREIVNMLVEAKRELAAATAAAAEVNELRRELAAAAERETRLSQQIGDFYDVVATLRAEIATVRRDALAVPAPVPAPIAQPVAEPVPAVTHSNPRLAEAAAKLAAMRARREHQPAEDIESRIARWATARAAAAVEEAPRREIRLPAHFHAIQHGIAEGAA